MRIDGRRSSPSRKEREGGGDIVHSACSSFSQFPRRTNDARPELRSRLADIGCLSAVWAGQPGNAWTQETREVRPSLLRPIPLLRAARRRPATGQALCGALPQQKRPDARQGALLFSTIAASTGSHDRMRNTEDRCLANLRMVMQNCFHFRSRDKSLIARPSRHLDSRRR